RAGCGTSWSRRAAQADERVDDVARRVRLAEGAGGGGHARAEEVVAEDLGDGGGEGAGVEAALREDAGGAGGFEGAGVAGLVVVGGERERHQHGGAADRGQLGEGGGAGAADDEVGGAVGGGHVVDGVAHLGGD